MDAVKTIVCLGDSITNDQEQPSYASYWQELCGEACKIVASGVNGETAYEGYFRLHDDVFPHRPKLVTIMYGHNDLHQSVQPRAFIFHLEKIINECRKQLVDQIWLLTPNQVGDPLVAAAYQMYLVNMKRLTRYLKVPYINLWSVFDNQPMDKIYTYSHDYVHPNELGHRLLADKLMMELRSRIK